MQQFRVYSAKKLSMENITFTISGTFTKESVEKYADFLGYTEMIPTPEPTPNTVTRIEFVENHVKNIFTSVLSEMQLNEAKEAAEALKNDYISAAEEAIKTSVISQITTQTVADEINVSK